MITASDIDSIGSSFRLMLPELTVESVTKLHAELARAIMIYSFDDADHAMDLLIQAIACGLSTRSWVDVDAGMLIDGPSSSGLEELERTCIFAQSGDEAKGLWAAGVIMLDTVLDGVGGDCPEYELAESGDRLLAAGSLAIRSASTLLLRHDIDVADIDLSPYTADGIIDLT